MGSGYIWLGQAPPTPGSSPSLIDQMGAGSRMLGYGLILAALAILYFRTRGR